MVTFPFAESIETLSVASISKSVKALTTIAPASEVISTSPLVADKPNPSAAVAVIEPTIESITTVFPSKFKAADESMDIGPPVESIETDFPSISKTPVAVRATGPTVESTETAVPSKVTGPADDVTDILPVASRVADAASISNAAVAFIANTLDDLTP